ncbi:MAG: hypothetical protein GY822_22485 [Deltaproteobacteria bacterium]|nr:hypothetical protein [Deltaproteobacteria bacterium]
MFPLQTITAFDAFLAKRNLRFEAIVIGGSALALLGHIDRQTRDFDILQPLLSDDIARASHDFAKETDALAKDWLNNGPLQLVDVLPEDWRTRLRPVFQGQALVLTTLGRSDLLRTKLFALCDRGTDLLDCIALSPSKEELNDAEPWVAQQDANELWPAHVHETLDDLRARLGYAL